MSKKHSKTKHRERIAQVAAAAPVAAPEVTTKDWGDTYSAADNENGWNGMLGMPGYSHTGVAVNPISSLAIAAAYACIRILVSDVAKLPLRLMKRRPDGTWTEDTNHPASRLLKHPNRRHTAFELKQHIVLSLQLTGNAYLAAVRGEDGKPEQLIPLIPSMVSISEAIDGRLFYTATSRLLPHTLGRFNEEEMVHVRNLSLDGGIRGASPIQLCAEALGLGLATQQLAATTFKNGGFFQGHLKTDQRMNKEALEQTADAWRSNHSGLGNAYKTPILTQGLEFVPMTMDPEALGILESRRFSVSEVARIFGVPSYKLGDNEKSSYNSLDAQAQDYIDSTLIPLTAPIEEALGKVLLFDAEQDRYRFSFDFSAMEKGDIKTRSDFLHQMLTDGVYSVNDVLRKMDEPTIGDEGDIRTKPLNIGVLGATQGLPLFQVDGPKKETEAVTPATADAAPAKPKDDDHAV